MPRSWPPRLTGGEEHNGTDGHERDVSWSMVGTTSSRVRSVISSIPISSTASLFPCTEYRQLPHLSFQFSLPIWSHSIVGHFGLARWDQHIHSWQHGDVSLHGAPVQVGIISDAFYHQRHWFLDELVGASYWECRASLSQMQCFEVLCTKYPSAYICVSLDFSTTYVLLYHLWCFHYVHDWIVLLYNHENALVLSFLL